jgi:hypothetical protein
MEVASSMSQSSDEDAIISIGDAEGKLSNNMFLCS